MRRKKREGGKKGLAMKKGRLVTKSEDHTKMQLARESSRENKMGDEEKNKMKI